MSEPTQHNPQPDPYGQPAGSPLPPPGHQPAGQPVAGRPPMDPYRTTTAPLSPEKERNLGMLAHLAPAILLPLSAGTLGFIASLVIYLVYKDRGPFVRAHAANALNVQIITGIVMLVSIPLMFVLVGFVSYFAAIAVATVIHIVAAVKANNGEWYQPPLTPSIVR